MKNHLFQVKVKKRYLVLILAVFLNLFLVFIYQIELLEVLFTMFLLVVTYYFISLLLTQEENKAFVKRNMVIAQNTLIDTNKFVVLIVKDDQVLWGNDMAYEEFPELLKDRDISEIILDNIDIDNTFKYNNSVYQATITDDIYIIENVTQETRTLRSLTEYKPNIAIFQIDNYNYIRNNVDDEKFIKFEKDLRKQLIKLFVDEEIFYQTIRSDRFQLTIPTSSLERMRKNKFAIINNIVKEFQEDGIMVTYSMGIATNYASVRQVGQKATEAFDLAITRGGAQVVLFDDNETFYYGGTNAMIKGNTKMKSRVIVNTMLNIINKRDVVYLCTHKNPDSDAIASMMLINYLIKEKSDVQVKCIVDRKISKEMETELQTTEDLEYQYNYVIDKTKRNLLIVLDTQSTKIISHPDLIEELEDVIIFDHHQTPVDYIKHTIFSWIEPSATSTVEMVSEMLVGSQVEFKNQQHLANAAILGILTDTNNLKYRVDANAIDILGFLVAAGGNIDKARERQYMDFTRFKMKNRILSQVNHINQFSFAELTVEYDDIFLSTVCNEMLEIKGVEAAIIVAPAFDDKFKVKIRSSDKINSKILIEEFGGGGHARQGAGILSRDQKNDFITKLLKFDQEGEE